jgi:hypothetical protein
VKYTLEADLLPLLCSIVRIVPFLLCPGSCADGQPPLTPRPRSLAKQVVAKASSSQMRVRNIAAHPRPTIVI